MKTSIKVGADTENLIVNFYKSKGFWVYLTPRKTNGQPIDIIAIKRNEHWLIDSKHVRENECSFPFDRIEPNQVMSMTYARKYANIDNLGFGIYFERNKQLYYLSYDKYMEMSKKGLKSANMNDLPLLDNEVKDGKD